MIGDIYVVDIIPGGPWRSEGVTEGDKLLLVDIYIDETFHDKPLRAKFLHLKTSKMRGIFITNEDTPETGRSGKRYLRKL